MTIPAQYAKFLAAIAGQALLFAQYEYGSGNKWVTLTTAAAACLGVAAVPNAPKPKPPAPHPQSKNVHVTPPAA